MWTMLLIGSLLAATPAGEKVNPFLAQARVFYQGLDYEKALERLKKAEAWPGGSPSDLAEIHLYRGLCQFQLGETEKARTAFRAALLVNPSLTLPPMTSPKIAEMFEKEAAEVRPAAAIPPPPDLPPPPPAVVVAPPPPEPVPAQPAPPAIAPASPTPAPTPLVPAVPPSPQPEVKSEPLLPWPAVAALSAAVVLAGAGGYFGMQSRSLADESSRATYASDHVELNDRARTNGWVANGLFAAGAGALGVAVYFTF